MHKYNFTYLISLLLFFFGCNLIVEGCIDPDACNYDSTADTDNGTCTYPEENYDCNDICLVDVDCEGICGGDGDIPSFTNDWSVQVIASMQPWNFGDYITDEFNYFGVSDTTSDNYDSMDIPDAPLFDTNWIKAYFYHPEWDSLFGDNFTQEYKSNEFCGTKEWNFNIEANSQGPLLIEFIVNNIPEDLTIEIIWDNESIIISEDSIIESTSLSNIVKEFVIKVSVN